MYQSDQLLWQQISDGNLQAYNLLFDKYWEPLFQYAYKIVRQKQDGDHPATALGLPLLRYAEVILIKAEAMLMQGKNADSWINKIRNRAGLSSVANADMTELKKQRRCELAGEWADRHRDLVRWGDAQAAYANPLHGVDGSIVWPARTYNPTIHDVWPVPQTEIDNGNGTIKQNQGWQIHSI